MTVPGQNEKVSQRAFLDRCTPESGRSFERGERQLRAKTGREQMQQHAVRGSQGYLITSSARVSTALSHSASLIKNRLLLDLQDGAQITQPALRRATPKLYLWDKLSRWRAVPTRITCTLGPSPMVLE